MSSGPRKAVVAGVNGSRSSLRAVAAAAVEAERRGWALQLIYVPVEPAGDLQTAGLLIGASRVATCSTVGTNNLVVTARVLEGPPVPTLLDAAAHAEMLVVGTGSTPGTLGPVATALRRAAAGPLLIVPLVVPGVAPTTLSTMPRPRGRPAVPMAGPRGC
ncbi:universal stress protein [Pseudonocardia sp. GCM10023141]|uniref:universal stress protein n=1 Tax=Pseudonocardia sp. GCM10023141 TaxID=3252653 RepID=UPI00360FEA56